MIDLESMTFSLDLIFLLKPACSEDSIQAEKHMFNYLHSLFNYSYRILLNILIYPPVENPDQGFHLKTGFGEKKKSQTIVD